MRPAGMSDDEDEDEDEDDDYFSMNIISKKRERSEKQPQLIEYLPPDHSDGLRTLLDTSSKSSLFHKAAEEGDFRKMEELLENGVSVDDSKINEWTPLMNACCGGKPEVVGFLLERGANPNLHKELFTPLMACCTRNYNLETDRLECARLLIQFGANVNATDKHKTTALMMAAGNGLSEIVNELLTSPLIDINMRDTEGWNALFYAVQNNNKYVVEQLMNAGIQVDILNRHGEYSAIQMAEMKNYKDIVKILKGESASEDSKTPQAADLKFDIIKNYYEDFRSQFPDDKGRGGFSRDVRDIFLGVGLGKLYDKLKIDVGFPDFLAGTNLAGLGIKYEPMRQKIQEGIHRYHLVPWGRNSLHPVDTIKDLNLDNYIRAISNVTKHMAIMYATLEYVGSGIKKWEGKTCATFDREIIELLVNSCVEIQKTKKLLRNISAVALKMKPTAEVEADFVGQKHIRHGAGGTWKGLLLKMGITASVIYLCYKLRSS